MPFKMKVSLLTIVTNLLILGFYLLGTNKLVSKQPVEEAEIINLVIQNLITCGVIFAVLMVIVAAINHKDALQGDDERDKLIGLYGDQTGYFGLTLVMALLLIWWWGGSLSTKPFAIASVTDSVNFIHFLFIGFLISDCAKSIRQIWLYQRGC
ncbi:hypothetical protein [Thalassotalea euphylliae]|uniref:Uncharacterized protein n=1 Tax=Thalassotalea euphylliae TaxID=1655234 RepID=A0A3E0U9B6_9GAMM|nr:hypothetical protein [Thalassotalea euphylliae]REL32432.1 hypothetical protein DXX94_17880 [Thalassotalea euphylliae]